MKALRRQLMAAIAMVLVAAIALGSSTYAWFAINNKVTATGMSVTTKVSNNLFIAYDDTDSTAAVGDPDFVTALVQTQSALLEPVSTIDGDNFYYTSTKNARADGFAISDEYIKYDTTGQETGSTGYKNKFSENYEITTADYPNGAVGYVDYAFRLKAVNTGASDQKVVMTGLNLVYGGVDAEAIKAFRTAVFVVDAGTTTQLSTLPSLDKTAVKGAFAPDGYEYMNGGAVGDETHGSISFDFGGNTSLNIADAAVIDDAIGAGETKYYKVVIRMWIEGTDKKCTNSTFANLTDAWNLDVAITLQDDTTGAVTKLNATSTAAKTDLSAATVRTSADKTVTIDGSKYYELSVAMTDGTKLYTTSTTFGTSSLVYKLVDGLYPVDVTNQCTLPTT